MGIHIKSFNENEFNQINTCLSIEDSNKLLIIQQQILELTITGSDY